MKLHAAILSLVILVQSIGWSFNEVIEINEFIKHAQFHSAQYGDNLTVFISKHYGSLKANHEKEHEEEKNEHDKLPFQHKVHIVTTVLYSFASSYTIELTAPELFEYKRHDFFYQELYSSQYLAGFFQPPKHS